LTHEVLAKDVLFDLVSEGSEEIINMVQGVLNRLTLLLISLPLKELQIVKDVILVLLNYKELEAL